MRAPVLVSGGKRLNFSRCDEWDGALDSYFTGFGKDQSCTPSASWLELCALATVIVAHPAYQRVTKLDGRHQPIVEDEVQAVRES